MLTAIIMLAEARRHRHGGGWREATQEDGAVAMQWAAGAR